MFSWLPSLFHKSSPSPYSLPRDASSRSFPSKEESNIEQNDDEYKLYMNCYVSQDGNWDCGVAVIRMVIKWSSSSSSASPSVQMTPTHALGLSEFYNRRSPLWTIDIFHCLLKSSSLENIVFYTTSIGVGKQF